MSEAMEAFIQFYRAIHRITGACPDCIRVPLVFWEQLLVEAQDLYLYTNQIDKLRPNAHVLLINGIEVKVE